MLAIAKFFDLIPKWVWAVVVAALSATSCQLHYAKGELEITVEKGKTKIAQLQSEHSLMVAQQEKDLNDKNAVIITKERELQVAQNETRKAKDDQVIAIAAVRDSLRVRYLSQESRVAAAATTSNPVPAASPNGQTTPVSNWSEFSDPIGDLIEEATRAEVIRVNLLSCYKSYDDAQALLKKLAETAVPKETPKPAKWF